MKCLCVEQWQENYLVADRKCISGTGSGMGMYDLLKISLRWQLFLSCLDSNIKTVSVQSNVVGLFGKSFRLRTSSVLCD